MKCHGDGGLTITDTPSILSPRR